MATVGESDKKQKIIAELKEIGCIMVYLAVSFSLLATIKSLVLIQLGVHNFFHGYCVALVEALALGKIVVLAQGLPLLNLLGKRTVIESVTFKSFVLSLIVLAGGKLEECIFAKHVADAPISHDYILLLTHFCALFIVFFILFVYRAIDSAFGHGKIFAVLTSRGTGLVTPKD